MVTATLAGFRERQLGSVQVRLGEETDLDFKLPLETMTETVEVTAEASIINPANTGPASNVAQETIENLPTISRGLDDFARTNPYFAQVAASASANALSVAGRNNRYNNIQIDGAVNNDLFGLAASGAPGGQADTQPISPRRHPGDPAPGRSLRRPPGRVLGRRAQRGHQERHQHLPAGRRTGSCATRASWATAPNDREFGTFDDDQFGASIGGPIKKDKAFFFVNGEMQRREVPNGFSVGGTRTGLRPPGRGRSGSRASCRPGTSTTRADPSEEFIRKTPNEQGLRPRGLQPLAAAPAHVPPQLRQRA